MEQTTLYKVAEHVFSINAESQVFTQLQNYEPFAVSTSELATVGADVLLAFELKVEMPVPGNANRINYFEETRQADEGQEIVCGRTELGEFVFEFFLGEASTGMLVCEPGYRKGRILLFGKADKFAVNNSVMVMYALATADKMTALFHSAIVSYEGKGYMFLGKSGTGKSTHARLWLKYIPGTELVNDDNPVVRLKGDSFWVYGSPWSGKTPCYKNLAMPLGAIVLLSQAPYNKIRPLQGIEAYVALVPSISGKRWDRAIADGLHQVENSIAQKAKMFHLECLPDEEAARVCHTAVAPTNRVAPQTASPAPSDDQIMAEAIRLVESGVCVTFPVNGRSMLPFIVGGRDSVILVKPQKVRAGDVVLALVGPNHYVVHRIIRIEGEKVTLMGDGNLVGTENCLLADIKAVATHVVKPNQKKVSLGDSRHRRAARIWFKALPFRRWLLRIYRIVHR